MVIPEEMPFTLNCYQASLTLGSDSGGDGHGHTDHRGILHPGVRAGPDRVRLAPGHVAARSGPRLLPNDRPARVGDHQAGRKDPAAPDNPGVAGDHPSAGPAMPDAASGP